MRRDKKTGIIYRQWGSPPSKAVLLLVHGLGGHSGGWEFLADFFLRQDISSYGIELRGFGETKSLKGHIDSFNIYFADIHRLYDMIIKENPGKKVFLAGESLGALISFRAVILNPDLFDGLICISPAFSNRQRLTLLGYIKKFSSLIYNPRKQFTLSFTPEMCTRDVDYQKVMDSDPLKHELATSKLLFNLLVTQARSRILKNRIRLDVLFLLAGRDELVDPEWSKKVFKRLEAKSKTTIEYPDMYHSLSIELGREKVFEDILKWLQSRI